MNRASTIHFFSLAKDFLSDYDGPNLGMICAFLFFELKYCSNI